MVCQSVYSRQNRVRETLEEQARKKRSIAHDNWLTTLIHFAAGWTKMPVVVEMANRIVMVSKASNRVSNRDSKASEDSRVKKVSKVGKVNRVAKDSRDEKVNKVSPVANLEMAKKDPRRVNNKAVNKVVR
jgi:hypothetical protein